MLLAVPKLRWMVVQESLSQCRMLIYSCQHRFSVDCYFLRLPDAGEAGISSLLLVYSSDLYTSGSAMLCCNGKLRDLELRADSVLELHTASIMVNICWVRCSAVDLAHCWGYGAIHRQMICANEQALCYIHPEENCNPGCR
jgi:hypothetical protein